MITGPLPCFQAEDIVAKLKELSADGFALQKPAISFRCSWR